MRKLKSRGGKTYPGEIYTYTNYYTIWGSLNLTALSVHPVDCDDDGGGGGGDDDFSVRRLKLWKLYVHSYTRLFPSAEYPL